MNVQISGVFNGPVKKSKLGLCGGSLGEIGASFESLFFKES